MKALDKAYISDADPMLQQAVALMASVDGKWKRCGEGRGQGKMESCLVTAAGVLAEV